MFATSKTSYSTSAVKGGVAAAVLALAVPFIAGWEGKRNHAYLDTIASPPVWTVCYGQTGPKAYKGVYYTDKECEDMLRQEVGEFYQRIAACMTNPNIPVSLQASLLELAYNAGSSAVCQSTAMRKANAGDYTGACDELDRWVKAGGKTIRGLVNRRNASQEICERDL